MCYFVHNNNNRIGNKFVVCIILHALSNIILTPFGPKLQPEYHYHCQFKVKACFRVV